MMWTIRNLSLSIVFLSTILFISYAPGISLASGPDKPLMIIRFNDGLIEYENKLKMATKMAMTKKPSVFFDVVAVSPETESSRVNDQLAKDVQFIAGKVAEQMKQSGVSEEMIRTSFKQNKLIKNNEIQIFVQ